MIRALLRAIDPRRRFCFACDKRTMLEHRHAVRPFEHLLRDEWRRRR